MSNEFVTASANFISESYSRENAGNIDFQEENTAYLVGIYEATKELLTDLIVDAEETDDEIAEEIADELIFNEEVFDYIDSLIDDEYLSEDVYIVPFSSFSTYLEETTEKCYTNILTEEYLEERLAGLLLRGARALTKGLQGVERAGGFRGVAAAGAKTAADVAKSGAGKAIRMGSYGAEKARQGLTAAGKGTIQGVGYGVEKARQGVQAARQGIRTAGKGAIQGVGYGVEKGRQAVQSAQNVASGIRKSGMETLGKLRQFGAEKIKQGQQLASKLASNIRQDVQSFKQQRQVRKAAEAAAKERQGTIQSRARNIQSIRAQKAQEAENRAKEVKQRAGNIQNIRTRKNIQGKLEKVGREYQAGVEKARQGN